MSAGKRSGWLLVLWLLGSLALRAQPAPAPSTGPGTAVLVPPPTAVPLVGPFTLAFRLSGVALVGQPEFPELEGFRKGGQARTTTTRLLPGGRRTTELTFTQRYLPYAEGDYQVPPFDLTVNGQVLHSPGGRVRVGAGPTPPATAGAAMPPGTAVGSLDQLLGKPKPQNFYEPPDFASLALEADQPRVYMGQGVHVALYFYLRPADQALLNFYDFNGQLTELLRQLRQPTTWEVPAVQPSVLPDTVRRAGGQVYLRFRLAENTYYPLTAQPLRFPALALTLTKFKLLKKPQPGDTERLAIYKTYTAPALTIAVRPLPPRPGGADSSSVAVGDYVLSEGISGTRFRTGEAFTYTFGVEGSGNMAALQLPLPRLRPGQGLEIYGPTIREEALPDGRQRKSFRFRVVAHRPGPVPLDSLFHLLFFNPTTAHYGTLRAEVNPFVEGAAQALATGAQPADDPFYGPALARADAQLQPLDIYQQVSRYASWLVAGLLVVATGGWWRARRG
ncbi:BatD family protein [Hymenobacter ginkgonis]|uniref:BatD family protein n=1 Tax=Hymenobacter ginkgonis TaxID=2682976 RepID=UPI0012FA2020|nr:BatD family protein [Hymenobacter ginkgonis]